MALGYDEGSIIIKVRVFLIFIQPSPAVTYKLRDIENANEAIIHLFQHFCVEVKKKCRS